MGGGELLARVKQQVYKDCMFQDVWDEEWVAVEQPYSPFTGLKTLVLSSLHFLV